MKRRRKSVSFVVQTAKPENPDNWIDYRPDKDLLRLLSKKKMGHVITLVRGVDLATMFPMVRLYRCLPTDDLLRAIVLAQNQPTFDTPNPSAEQP